MIWDDNGLTLIFQDSRFLIPQLAVQALAATAAILLFTGFARRWFFRQDSGCRWRRARDHRLRPPFRKWRCKACLAEAYSSDRRPPKDCKKALKLGL